MKRGWCLLHVGTHKTGTTAVQQRFCDIQENLANKGILYPQSILKNNYVAHQPFARQLLSDGYQQNFVSILQRLQIERERSRCDNVVVSSELLESISRDQERMLFLRDCLGALFDRVYVAAVTRQPERYLVSLYKELSRVSLLSWNLSELFTPYLKHKRVSVTYKKIDLTVHHEFDYGLFEANLSEIFGKDSVLFLEYEPLCHDNAGDIIVPFLKNLCSRFGLANLDTTILDIRAGLKINKSKPLYEAMFLYALNRHALPRATANFHESTIRYFGRHSKEKALILGVEAGVNVLLPLLGSLGVSPADITQVLQLHSKLISAEVLIDQLVRSIKANGQ